MGRRIMLAAVLLVVVLLGWLLVVKVIAARRGAQSTQIQNALRQVCFGLSSYDDAYKRLPPAIFYDDQDTVLYSWRRPLLIFNEAWKNDVDQELPWTSSEYEELKKYAPECYCLLDEHNPDRGRTMSSVYAVIGPGTAFAPDPPLSLKDIPGDTILIIESTKIGKHWLEPGDFDISTIPPNAKTLGEVAGGEVPGIVHVGFADGAAWALSAETPLERIRPYFLVESAGDRPREEGLGEFRVK